MVTVTKPRLKRGYINMSKALGVSTSRTLAERRKSYAAGLYASGVSQEAAKKAAKKIIKHGKKERLH